MSRKRVFARFVLFAVLQFGALLGVPMTQEQIEEIQNMAARTRVQRVLKQEDPPD